MTDAKCLKIGGIKTDAGHSRLSLVNHRLDGNLVVDVDCERIHTTPAFSIADFTIALRLCQLPRPQLLPSLAVQQLLVSWVSAHIRSPFISKRAKALRLQFLHQSRCGRWWCRLRIALNHVFIYHGEGPPNPLVLVLAHRDQYHQRDCQRSAWCLA